MARFVIFDLFHTLVDARDAERDRVTSDLGGIVGVEPAALVEAYHDTWRQRLVRWDAEYTVRVLAQRLGGTPTRDQVVRAPRVAASSPAACSGRRLRPRSRSLPCSPPPGPRHRYPIVHCGHDEAPATGGTPRRSLDHVHHRFEAVARRLCRRPCRASPVRSPFSGPTPGRARTRRRYAHHAMLTVVNTGTLAPTPVDAPTLYSRTRRVNGGEYMRTDLHLSGPAGAR